MPRLLIIEDEKILREEIADWLLFEDFEVVTAANGAEGVEAALEHQPDLVLCDITMPKLDGYGVLLELRANPATAAIPFIFMTARVSHDDIRRGMQLGADDYITKPFTQSELMGAINSRFEKKAAATRILDSEINSLKTALEQEHERLVLKSKLVGMFSHDFRNPLASILSSSNLLREYSDRMDTSKRNTHFDRIDLSVRHLLQMLEDMVVIAQIETGNLEFKPQLVNLDQFLQDLVGEFQEIHRQTHDITYSSDFHQNTMADLRLVRQIAANLISNAVKYSPQSRDVVVRFERSGERLALIVKDHGIGIPEADQPSIFNSFRRASNTGEISGHGLGMAIVREAAEIHGGSVHLESQVGVGTTVRILLPA